LIVLGNKRKDRQEEGKESRGTEGGKREISERKERREPGGIV
jgi:hypothetical protein